MKVKHKKTIADYDKPYEENDIRLKGILYFGVGLLILIVVTFALMWSLLGVMRDQAAESKETSGPMSMTDVERLPPEPRLQAAPGFGIDSPNGRTNLELMGPHAEYLELRQQWDTLLKNGEVDSKTGTIVMMPVETAKAKFLEQSSKASTPQGDDQLMRSRMIVSDSSAGRMASEKHR